MLIRFAVALASDPENNPVGGGQYTEYVGIECLIYITLIVCKIKLHSALQYTCAFSSFSVVFS